METIIAMEMHMYFECSSGESNNLSGGDAGLLAGMDFCKHKLEAIGGTAALCPGKHLPFAQASSARLNGCRLVFLCTYMLKREFELLATVQLLSHILAKVRKATQREA